MKSDVAPFQIGKGAIAFIRKCPAYHAQLSHFGLHKSNQTLATYLWTSQTIRLDECLGDDALIEGMQGFGVAELCSHTDLSAGQLHRLARIGIEQPPVGRGWRSKFAVLIEWQWRGDSKGTP